jgi:hypothetical protein
MDEQVRLEGLDLLSRHFGRCDPDFQVGRCWRRECAMTSLYIRGLRIIRTLMLD